MRVRPRAYIVVLCWLFALPLYIAAQTFQFRQYTTKDGLPIDNVFAAAQDGRGFMWFATSFGIAKFDGYAFTNYSRNNGIHNLAVTDIVYAGGDSLIFLSYPLTIQSIHYDGTINTLVETAAIALHQIIKQENSFYCYHRNRGTFIVLQANKRVTYEADNVFGGHGILIHAIFSLKEKGIAFCTNKGLYIKKGDEVIHLLQDQDVQAGILTAKGNIELVCNSSIVEMTSSFQWQNTGMSFPPGFKPYHIEEENGNIWFRDIEKGVYRLRHGILEEMSLFLKLKEKTVHEFFADRDGNFWINTDGNGILLKANGSFENYDINNGLPNNKILCLHRQNRKLYIGTENGIAVKEGNTITKMVLPSSKDGLKYTYQLQQANDEKIGVSIGRTFNFPHTLKNQFVWQYNDQVVAYNSLFAWQKDENNLWIFQGGYSKKLCRIDKENNIKDSIDLSPYDIMKVYKMIFWNNAYWLGTDKGLLQIQHQEITLHKNINTEKTRQVFDFAIDKTGRLWIATEIGLFICDGYKFTTVIKGSTMGSNYCRTIAIDNRDNIWAATWDGIFKTDGISKTYFTTAEGLPSKTVNAILVDEENQQLYAGTENGLAVINIDTLIRIKPGYDIFITCTLTGAGGVQTKVIDSSALSPSQNNLVFYLSIPYYQSSGDVHYEYKIDNGPWSTTRNPAITISDIGSGKHVFYARAKVHDNAISKSESVFNFIIKTPYYETWWFWLTIAVICQLIIFVIINHFNKKAKEKKLAIQSQQAEYASLKQQAFTLLMNPHFIFNALNSVQYYVNKQDRQSANKYLSDFATLIRRSFDASQRSFVTLEEELETIRLYLQLEKMRFTDKFEYNINVNAAAADEDWMLPSMMLQPFLENAVLHGLMPLDEKGMLTIDVTAENNCLRIIIADNGIGIEKSKALRSGVKHKSKGMQLINERLELLSKLGKEPIGLTITVLDPGAPNPGTKITLSIPQEVYEVFQQQRNPA